MYSSAPVAETETEAAVVFALFGLPLGLVALGLTDSVLAGALAFVATVGVGVGMLRSKQTEYDGGDAR